MFLLITTLIKFALIALLFALPLATLLTWMERRQSAFSQDRRGPERAEIRILGRPIRLIGLLHPLADAVKMFFKESFVPARADRLLFHLAPLIGFTTALVSLALIPFGPDIATADVPLLGRILSEETLRAHPVIPLQIARLDAGVLLIFAVSSLGIYGATLGGWASNNRFALLGGMRAAAQSISYEVALGLTVVGVLIAFGTTETSQIVLAQVRPVVAGLPAWGVFVQPFAAVLFLTAAIAETKRGPFDLPEGESEIIGYFVEYSSMGFGLFMIGEFVEIVLLATVFVTLFLGGHTLPWVFGANTWQLGVWSGVPDFFGLAPGFWNALAGMLVFGVKVFFISALQLQIRWTLPRFRYDQLMRLGWKNLLPLALANIFVTAGLVYLDPTLVALTWVSLGCVLVFAVIVMLGPKRASESRLVAESHPGAESAV